MELFFVLWLSFVSCYCWSVWFVAFVGQCLVCLSGHLKLLFFVCASPYANLYQFWDPDVSSTILTLNLSIQYVINIQSSMSALELILQHLFFSHTVHFLIPYLGQSDGSRRVCSSSDVLFGFFTSSRCYRQKLFLSEHLLVELIISCANTLR